MSHLKFLNDLRPLVSTSRLQRIEKVAHSRLKGVTCVIEGLQDTGNISAIQRTCDAFGVLNIHSIKRFSLDVWKQHRKVSKGAEKWTNFTKWDEGRTCLKQLKEDGFNLVVASMETKVSKPIDKLDFSKPQAIIFGNEMRGFSDEVHQMKNESVHIPMHGFVESLNVSVAAACLLNEAATLRRQWIGGNTDLSELECAIHEVELLYRTIIGGVRDDASIERESLLKQELESIYNLDTEMQLDTPVLNAFVCEVQSKRKPILRKPDLTKQS
eukprot:m.69914 g.69914  ORF g.69914 m.69914 type:complete len:270 (-) comp8289_c1_seq1:390-1199(-)